MSSLERAPVFRDGKTWLFGVSLWTASVFGPADDGQSAVGNSLPAPAANTVPRSPPSGAATGPALVSGLIRPFPVVRIKGRLTAGGALIELLTVKAPADATIRVRCRGSSCPPRVRNAPAVAGASASCTASWPPAPS